MTYICVGSDTSPGKEKTGFRYMVARILAVLIIGSSVQTGATGDTNSDRDVDANGESTLLSKHLSKKSDYSAPDGSDVRLLVQGSRGSMAHFQLAPGRTSEAVAHLTVEEIWYFLAGRGEMWRKLDNREEITEVYPGMSINIPVGAYFQFRALGDKALEAVAVTIPPWPGRDEAYDVPGRWPSVAMDAPE